MARSRNNTEMSYDTKTLLTVLLLLFFYPAGLILMWVWMKWPLWAKILISLPILLVFIFIPLAILLIMINPVGKLAEANNAKRSSDVNHIMSVMATYQQTTGSLPEGITEERQEISSTGIDICDDLVPAVTSALPVDPEINNGEAIVYCTDGYSTGYEVALTPEGYLTVWAPNAERDATIFSSSAPSPQN